MMIEGSDIHMLLDVIYSIIPTKAHLKTDVFDIDCIEFQVHFLLKDLPLFLLFIMN